MAKLAKHIGSRHGPVVALMLLAGHEALEGGLPAALFAHHGRHEALHLAQDRGHRAVVHDERMHLAYRAANLFVNVKNATPSFPSPGARRCRACACVSPVRKQAQKS